MTRPHNNPADKYRAGQTNTRGSIICGAKNRDGTPCGKYPLKGATRCARHGGKSPKAQAAARRRTTTNQAAAQLRALGHDPDAENIDPADALLRLVTHKHLEVQWLRHVIQQIGDGTDPADDPMSSPLVWGVTTHQTGVGPMGPVDVESKGYDLNVWVSWLHKAEDQLARFAAAALKAGVQQARLEDEKALALTVVGVIRQLLGGLGLTPDQKQTADVLVPNVLRALATKENTP